jgi:hypothetical protein
MNSERPVLNAKNLVHSVDYFAYRDVDEVRPTLVESLLHLRWKWF